MKNKIKVILNGKPITATKGLTLSEITNGERPCGGHGRCGKCKVLVNGHVSEPTSTECNVLSDNELAHGVRLACLTRALGDCEIETCSAVEKPQIVTDGVLPEFKLNPTFSDYGTAIDIGTTTLVARLYDNGGNLLFEVSHPNPQAKWGADVISRIEAALDGNAKWLADTIQNALNDIFCEFAAVIDTKKIDGVVITGNTVMLSLLTGQSVEPFSHAPFDAKRLFGETLSAGDLSLSALLPETQIYLPPCISAFIGADITCALLATKLCEGNTAMLADIGTNGEMALWHNGKLTVCSTAAGPAFEGVGISMGMRGVAGAIDKVAVTDRQIKMHVINDQEPIGICGSGLVDAVACLIETGEIDETGRLKNDSILLTSAVALFQKDIRMLQLAKSAICAGLITLIDVNGLRPSDIQRFYIAGGFGNYLNKENASRVGLLPKVLSNAMCTVGNAALSGAVMILLDSTMKATAQNISQKADVLDLSTNCVFSEHYMMGMLFEEQ